MKKLDLKSILIISFVVLIIAGVIYIPKILRRKGNRIDYSGIEIKDNYSVNEYIPVYVDDLQMTKIYYKDYLNWLINDMDGSYNLLDNDYRDKVFENIYNYKQYINSLKLSLNADISKYAVYERGNFKYYDFYDSDGHRFIFKTDGVLQYKVYFDDIDEGEE